MTLKHLPCGKIIGLFIGLLLFFSLLILPLPDGMKPEAMKVAAVAALMATFWISEVIPIPATALLPIALFPLLGIMPTAEVSSAYGNHLIYLFLGGFLIAMAIEKWRLHKRIALLTVHVVGHTPKRLVLGFMLATAFLSAWISNTATAMIMVTIGLSVLRQIAHVQEGDDLPASRFGTTLMLSIAYAASIGGVATLIGTPPNAILVGVLEQRYGIVIGFAEWMLFGVPLSLTMLGIAWFYLTRVVLGKDEDTPVLSRDTMETELANLGPMSTQEFRVLIIFAAVVASWLFRGLIDHPALHYVTDSSVAISGAILLFLLPSGRENGERLLDWAAATRLPWDIIILFGGGFALASGFSSSGLTEWIGAQQNVMAGSPLILTVMLLAVLIVFLSEVTSNTAIASLFLPILAGFALAMETHPLFLMVPAALAASFAFMLPVATPPNAIAFSSRQFSISTMARTGIWLNLIGVLVITVFVTQVLPLIWSVD